MKVANFGDKNVMKVKTKNKLYNNKKIKSKFQNKKFKDLKINLQLLYNPLLL